MLIYSLKKINSCNYYIFVKKLQMKLYKIFLLFTVLLCLPISSFSWGKKGHELVAEIALKYLDKNTKKLVKKHLAGMTIQEAANWMDNIKKDKSYDKLKPLHYVNFEKDEVVKDHCCDNIISALNSCISKLKNHKELSNEEIKINLLYLFHLIGDLHQPLHIGYGIDKGGNTFQVNFNNNGTNLHSLYDTGIIEFKNVKLRQCLKESVYTQTEIDSVQQINVVKWSVETRKKLGDIYTVENNKISKEYVNLNLPIIKNQIHLAGIRLAGVLKQVFNS